MSAIKTNAYGKCYFCGEMCWGTIFNNNNNEAEEIICYRCSQEQMANFENNRPLTNTEVIAKLANGI